MSIAMTLDHLKLFRDVALARNITRGAEMTCLIYQRKLTIRLRPGRSQRSFQIVDEARPCRRVLYRRGAEG